MAKYKLQLEKGASERGAQMGRANTLPENPKEATPRLHLTHVRFNAGGYDFGGAYWGTPENLYCAETGDEQEEYVRLFVRANNVMHARAEVRKIIPYARFYR